MPKKFIVANWKMHKTVREALAFLDEFIPIAKDLNDREIGIAPTFICIESVGKALINTSIKLCAQNAFYENKGAYTGEVSPLMLKDCGVKYVIIGHSERRKYFYENDDIINKKIHACIKEGLKVIFCIGETLEDRQNNKTMEILKTQIRNGLLEINSPEALTIAYEPVWAIGTGVVATEEQIKQSHLFIRNQLKEIYGERANEVRILYGGSVTPENIKPIMEIDNVEGVLVGGASLDPLKFARIVKY
ncbi:triose-phosphate isomerase [Thermodesulfovibrio yellowstonii]|uniref:Triosephosphate isomerase n=1 Tax=Thermodesulfovibrio yellowstonii TaxID=28262 RepID=A0A9W6GGF7_9BACT|nr:triose-phosphate isomerase [Thermodesulfovibrio islandicus]GLI53695.1 triosephosphate isomerase [Thermodesulfovibrio islandicus]